MDNASVSIRDCVFYNAHEFVQAGGELDTDEYPDTYWSSDYPDRLYLVDFHPLSPEDQTNGLWRDVARYITQDWEDETHDAYRGDDSDGMAEYDDDSDLDDCYFI